MILSEETFDTFGYYPEKLSKNSHKKINAKCDFCNDTYQVIYRNYLKNISPENSFSSCKKCRFKKAKITNKIKYGVENVNILPEFKEKSKQTNLKKYGVEFVSQSENFKERIKKILSDKTQKDKDKIKEKSKKTCQKKYGVDNFSQTKQWKEKIIEKYKNNPLIIKEKKEKYKKTCLEKHGVENCFQSKTVKEKIKQTNLERYGTEIASKSEIVKEKIQQTLDKRKKEEIQNISSKRQKTNIEKYGYPFATQSNEIKNKTKQTLLKKGLIKIYDEKTILEWAKEKDISRTHAGQLLKNYGPDFFNNYEKGITDIELIIKQILINNNIKFKFGQNIFGRKSDFLINDNLIIECDSNYWHSDFNKTHKKYHINKKKHYENLGYKPLFFRSDEIVHKTSIVESIILNHLNLNKIKVGARKCLFKKIDTGMAQIFFMENHLMSYGRGVTFGLFYNNELVSAMQFYNKGKGLYEISRFCNKKGHSVYGGFSKIISNFELIYSPQKIITFIDCRYGFGNYLENLGFQYQHTYLSFKWTNGKICYHRMAFPKNSGYENKLGKIWDCGQAKYIKTIKNPAFLPG